MLLLQYECNYVGLCPVSYSLCVYLIHVSVRLPDIQHVLVCLHIMLLMLLSAWS